MISNCDEEFQTDFGYCTSVQNQLPDAIKGEIGCKDLLAYPEDRQGPAEASNLEGFVLRGNFPPYLFDALEIFYATHFNNEKKNRFQTGFNQIMEESDLPWRMANGHIFPVDSAYIEEVILRRAYSLLQEVGFQGALQEFEEARVELTNGDYKGAVQKANLAFESTMKGILGVEKARPGELVRGIIDSGIVPEYHAGFLKVFEEHILRCVPNLRNQELGAGHGQGKEVNIVPKSLAELAVNLAGVMIKFLIERHLD